MKNSDYKKSGELRGRKKDKAYQKLSERKVRRNKDDIKEEILSDINNKKQNMKTLVDIKKILDNDEITISDALNDAYDLGVSENIIEKLIAELQTITTKFPYVEYYSHENSLCYKIENVYTKYGKEIIVLCKVDEGIKNALSLAVEVLKKKQKDYYEKNNE